MTAKQKCPQVTTRRQQRSTRHGMGQLRMANDDTCPRKEKNVGPITQKEVWLAQDRY